MRTSEPSGCSGARVVRFIVQVELLAIVGAFATPADAAEIDRSLLDKPPPLTVPLHAPPLDAGLWVPPFEAWVSSEFGFVRERPTAASRLVSLLRQGDTVRVLACQPRCNALRGWALLEPRGAVPLANLRAGSLPSALASRGSAAQYVYGRVPRPGTPVFAEPRPTAARIRKERAEYRLAFVPDAQLEARGWLRRPDGGYMRKADIKMFTPSEFTGIRDPQGTIAFVRRKVALRPGAAARPPKDPSQIQWFARYDRLKVLGERGNRVEVAGGWVPRSLVRIVRPVVRPKGVGPQDRWLYVDLGDQVLTAYIGDKPALATLVSTGKAGTSTKTGKFVVYAKTVHSSMRGRGANPYYAEEVPHVLHYDAGRALHGAYWHDQFGIVKSHGCINLSPRDAAWLFDFVPPAIPAGWHAVLPQGWRDVPGPHRVGEPSTVVSVLVDKPGRRLTRPQAMAAVATAKAVALR